MANTKVTTNVIADDAITGAKIADDAINSEHYTDGSIDTAHIADLNVTTAKIAADAITGAKIADDAINSEHYTDGSIDTAHIADDQVTLAKMAGLARGKIIYGDSSGNPAALALGSNGQVLKSDGTDIAWAADTDTALTSEEVQDIVGAMFSSNTETGITATYQDADGTVDLVIGADSIVSSMLDTNIDIAGTFDVTGATTLDAALTVAGKVSISDSSVGTDATADDSNFIKLTNKDAGTVNEVWGLGFSTESSGTDYLGAYVHALGNYASNFNTSLVFGTRPTSSGAAAERMRIDSLGKVGIGNTSPEYPLQIDGSNVSSGGGLATVGIIDTGTDYNETNPGGGIAFRGKYNNGGSTTNFATVQGVKENTTDGNYASSIRFTTRSNGGNLTEKMRIKSSGYVEMAGASDVRLTLGSTGTAGTNDANWVRGESSNHGHNTPGDYYWEVSGNKVARLDADGLRFGTDTAAANGLDDYEEGSWTPAFGQSGGGDGGTTYTYQFGRYTKIGNVVHCYIDVQHSQMWSWQGSYMYLTLPFTAANVNWYSGVTPWEVSTSFTDTDRNFTGYVGPNTNELRLYKTGTGNNGSPAVINWNQVGRIAFSVTYTTPT